MLSGPDLGKAIEDARQKKNVSKAELARNLGVEPPSIQDMIKLGRIDKSRLNDLFEYFEDVVGAGHWGLNPPKKKPLTTDERAVCRTLKKVWDGRAKELGLTQEVAAERLGVSQGAVSHFFSERNAVNTDAVLKFALLLRVPIEAINKDLSALIYSIPHPDNKGDNQWAEDRDNLAKLSNEIMQQQQTINDMAMLMRMLLSERSAERKAKEYLAKNGLMGSLYGDHSLGSMEYAEHSWA